MTAFAPNRRPHPLIAAYLEDLDRALIGADPQERADTLAAVREHIHDALDGKIPNNDAAKAVLADLGSVECVAAAATPALEPTAPTAELAPSSAPETNGMWVATVLLISAVFSLILVLPLPWVAAALAIGTLVVSVSQTRRAVGSEGMLRTSIALSTATLVAVASMAVFLVSATDVVTAVDDVQTVQPSDG